MAFFNFYIVAGGSGASDINAGTSTGAAQVTTTNGNWNAATGVFIAASGTPFASTVVGDYASVYVDASANTSFVGKVTTVTSNVNITVDVTTLKYGTPPTTNATLRSCTINGAWTSEIVPSTSGWGVVTVPQSTKFNVKGNLTFAANRTFSNAGTDDGTKTVWYSGYNANPGDLDADTTNGLAKPVWTLGATRLTVGVNDNIWSSFDINGNGNFDIVRVNASTVHSFVRCRINNTNSGTAAQCIQNNAGVLYLFYCYLKTPTTATTVALVDSVSGNVFGFGSVFDSGGFGAVQHNTTAGNYHNCVFLNNVGTSLQATSGNIRANFCTFYSPGTTAINWANSIPSSGCSVVGCLFMNTTNGIKNSSGVTNQGVFCFRSCNDYYNVTNPEVGFNDIPAFFGQTDSSLPVFSTTDMTPLGSSNAHTHGFPGIVENQTYAGTADIGAVQAGAGGGGGIAIFG